MTKVPWNGTLLHRFQQCLALKGLTVARLLRPARISASRSTTPQKSPVRNPRWFLSVFAPTRFLAENRDFSRGFIMRRDRSSIMIVNACLALKGSRTTTSILHWPKTIVLFIEFYFYRTTCFYSDSSGRSNATIERERDSILVSC